MVGCVLHWWKFACVRRELMVRVGAGKLLNLFCAAEFGVRFWKHLVGLCAPEPHGGPSRVIIGPSPFVVCGSCVKCGVFIIR